MATIKAGTYRFNDVLTIPNASMPQDIEFTSQWSVPQEYWDYYMQEVGDIDLGGIDNPVIIKCNKMLVGLGDDGYHDLSYNVTESNSFVSIDGEELLFPSYGERYLYVCYSNESGYWKYGFLTITVTEDTEVSEDFYNWFVENANPIIKRGTYRFNNDASPIIHLFDKSNQTEVDEVFNLYSFPIEPVSYSVGEEDFIVHVSYITPLIAYKYVSPTFGYEVTQIQKAAADGYGEFIGTSDNDITEFTIPVDTEVTTEVATWFAENAAEQKYLSGLWLSHPVVSAIPYETIPWNYDKGEEETLYNKYGIEIEPILVEEEYWAYGFTPILTRCSFDTDGTLIDSAIGGIGKFKGVGEEDYYYTMTVTYAPDYDTAHIIPGNYNALSVDWVKSNFTELKALSGTWWIDADSPAIPYEVIPYHSGREEEEALYNNYGVDIEPIYYPPNNNTVYGGTPYLTMAYVGEDGEILGYSKRIINKVKEEGEDFYRYKSYTGINSDYNKITVIPGYYNAMIVDWFYQHATNVRFARLYPSDVAYSSSGKCFKVLTTDEPIVQVAGLYDDEDNQIASWDTLVNTYGMNCEQNYTDFTYKSDTASPSNVLRTSDLLGGRKLIVANNVTSIGNYAFCACDSLTSIIIPDSVTSIGEWVFYGCTGLTSVTIGNGVTSIGLFAFAYCTGLTDIVIPDSVTNIGGYAFYECDNLTSVYYTGTEEEWASIGIGAHNENLTNATIHYNYQGGDLT